MKAKDVNNDTKPMREDMDKPADAPNTPAEEAAKRLGFEPFDYAERS